MNHHARLSSVIQPFDPIDLALRQLMEDEEAVALARIVAIAEPFLDHKARSFAITDCLALAGDRLDDLIFDAARDHDLDRDQLPVRDVIVGRMVEEDGRLPVADAPVTALAPLRGQAPQAGLEQSRSSHGAVQA